MPPRQDIAMAFAMLGLSLAQVLVDPIAARPVAVLYAALFVIPVAWWRSAPIPATLVSASAMLIPTPEGFLYLGYVVLALLVYGLGSRPPTPLGYAALAWTLITATVSTVRGPEEPIAVLTAWLLVVGAYTVARVILQHRTQNRRLEALTEQLLVEQSITRDVAAADERTRIAQELHDVVGHEVTLISLQSEAAAAALARDPALAVAPLEAVRATAHRASLELRGIIGLLGESSVDHVGPEGIEQVAARARAAGIANTLTQQGTAWPDAARFWLAIQRIVTESLTNAGKHSAGSMTSVVVIWRPASVEVSAVNDAPGPAGPAGQGIHGMAERCRLLGGTLRAGPVDGGRFEVRATLPRRERR